MSQEISRWLIAATLLIAPDVAQAGPCAGLEWESDAKKAFECIGEYEAKIAELNEGLTKFLSHQKNHSYAEEEHDEDHKDTFAVSGHNHDFRGVPSGIVVASAVQCKDLTPGRWSDFEEGAGRFLIGAGPNSDVALKSYTPFGRSTVSGWEPSTGGEEEVTLIEAQMPKHQHKIVIEQHSGGTPGMRASGNGKYSGPHARKSSIQGGSKPHNNMPPYIALYFCKKD